MQKPSVGIDRAWKRYAKASTLRSEELTLEANWYHRNTMNYASNGAPYSQAASTEIFGASLTYELQDRLTAALFCKNCANRLTQRWGFNSVRTIGASVHYEL